MTPTSPAYTELVMLLVAMLGLTLLTRPPLGGVVTVGSRTTHRCTCAVHRCSTADTPATLAVSGAEVLRRWREHLVTADRADSTVKRYAFLGRDFFSFLETRGRTWHQARLRDLTDWLKRPTRGGGARSSKLSTSSIGQYGGAISGLYRFAVTQRLIRHNPMDAWAPPRRSARRPRYIPREDVRAAIGTAADDERMRVLLWFLFHTGARIGEAAVSMVEDVHFDDGELTLHGKGRKDRTIPLHPELAGILHGWLAGRSSGPLFPSKTDASRGVIAHHLCVLVNEYLRELGVAETSHSLRHLAIKEVVRASGYSLLAGADYAGHASTDTTRPYVAGANLHVHEAVAARPELAHDYEVVVGRVLREIRAAGRGPTAMVGGPNGLGARAHPRPAELLAPGHEPSRPSEPT